MKQHTFKVDRKINIRDLIRQCLQIVVVLVSLNMNLVWAESKHVEVTELGFTISKPADWYLYQQTLKKPLGQDSPSIEAIIAHYAKTPVAAISKFPTEYAKDINPNIRVTLKPVRGTVKNKEVLLIDPQQLLGSIDTSLKPVLPNIKVDMEAQILKVSGYHPAFVRVRYTMLLNNGDQTRDNSDLWLMMPNGD